MTVAGRHSRLDVLVIAAIGLAAFLTATWYVPVYRNAGGVPFFYQQEFGPAVMWACGRGFVNPDETTAPALEAFLAERAQRFQCQELPASLRLKPVDAFQSFSRYLFMPVAGVWRVHGITWRSVDLVTAAFFSVALAAAYGALRFVCGRGLSLVVTLLWATSTWHLQNLPHLRDYSKVPFFVLMLIATAAASVEHRRGWMIALGIAFGAVQGLGYGMRADVGLNFIPFLVVLFAGRSEGLFRNLPSKLACAGTAIAMFAVIAYPIQASYEKSGALWHVILLGLTSPYDDNLHLGVPRPPYNFGYKYHDGYVEAVVASYWSRLHPDARLTALGSPSYGSACRAYYEALAASFPGDMVTRMAAASVLVLNTPFSLVYGRVPLGISNPVLVWLSGLRSSLMEIFENAGPMLVAGVLVLIGIERLRYACIAFVLLVASAAYPSLQYQYRHTFHLELLVLAAVAVGGSLAWRMLLDGRRRGPARGLKSLALVAGLFLTAVAAMVVARTVQAPRVRALLTAYSTAPVDPIPAQLLSLDDGQVRMRADVFGAPPPGDSIQAAMLVAEVDSSRCGSFASTFRYEGTGPGIRANLSWTAAVPATPGHGPTRVFLPVYSLNRGSMSLSRFVGVDVPASSASCVRLFRVRDLKHLPLLLPATLTADWATETLHQRLPLDRVAPPVLWRRIVHWWPGVSQLG